MSRYALRTVVAVALVAAWCAAGAYASDVIPAAAAGVPERPGPPKMVVLKNGQIVEGEFRFAQGGYEVASGGGRIFLADSYIWFTAESRRHAFEQLRQRTPFRTADDHVGLARWCITNRLYSCAQDELRAALDLEPGHAEARSTLGSLDDVLGDGPARPAASADPTANSSGATIGGLRPESAKDFVTKVQPLLVNRCGNASCHGSGSENAFTLRNVRAGHAAFRRLTQDNLSAALSQITPARLETSPLLTEPRRPAHGGLRKPIFLGPSGEAQFALIAAWAAGAAGSASTDDGPVVASGLVLTAAATPSDAAESAAVENSAARPVVDPAADLLRRTLADDRPDAFDPGEFNRRFGPRAGRAPLSPIEGPTR